MKKEYSQRKFAHIFLLWGCPFLWSCATAEEHTRESWQVCLSDQQVSPFAWETSGSLSFTWTTRGSLLQSQITDLILSFQVLCGNMNILFASRIFCLWLVIGTYTLPFFLVICWSYLRTAICVTLFMCNKLYSSPSSFIFSFLWNQFVDVILRPHWIC